MRCIYCGAELPDNIWDCPDCGMDMDPEEVKFFLIIEGSGHIDTVTATVREMAEDMEEGMEHYMELFRDPRRISDAPEVVEIAMREGVVKALRMAANIMEEKLHGS